MCHLQAGLASRTTWMSALWSKANPPTVGQVLLLLRGIFAVGFGRRRGLGLIRLGERGTEYANNICGSSMGCWLLERRKLLCWGTGWVAGRGDPCGF